MILKINNIKINHKKIKIFSRNLKITSLKTKITPRKILESIFIFPGKLFIFLGLKFYSDSFIFETFPAAFRNGFVTVPSQTVHDRLKLSTDILSTITRNGQWASKTVINGSRRNGDEMVTEMKLYFFTISLVNFLFFYP